MWTQQLVLCAYACLMQESLGLNSNWIEPNSSSVERKHTPYEPKTVQSDEPRSGSAKLVKVTAGPLYKARILA